MAVIPGKPGIKRLGVKLVKDQLFFKYVKKKSQIQIKFLFFLLILKNLQGALFSYLLIFWMGFDHHNFLNGWGDNSVSKFQAQSASSDDVNFDYFSTPGTTVDGCSIWRESFFVEPAPGNQKGFGVYYRNGIEGIPGMKKNNIPKFKTAF